MTLHLVASTPAQARPDRDRAKAIRSVPLIQIRPQPQPAMHLFDRDGRMASMTGFFYNLILSFALGFLIIFIAYKVIVRFL